MKKILLLFLTFLLVACSNSDEKFESSFENEETIESMETIEITETQEIKEETIVETEIETVDSSNYLTEEELFLSEIAKAEVEYFGLEKYYSRQRIFNMLTSGEESSEIFSEKVANYSIDKVEIDFKKNALSTASIYAYDNWWSREYIEDTLRNIDLFTEEEIKYAMDNLDDVDY